MEKISELELKERILITNLKMFYLENCNKCKEKLIKKWGPYNNFYNIIIEYEPLIENEFKYGYLDIIKDTLNFDISTLIKNTITKDLLNNK